MQCVSAEKNGFFTPAAKKDENFYKRLVFKVSFKDSALYSNHPSNKKGGDAMSCGTKVRSLREQKGMPRASCDEIFNLMRGTVSNWENGYAEPEEDLLPDIARFFGVKTNDLLRDIPLAG